MGKNRFEGFGQRLTHFIVTNRWWLMAFLSILATINEIHDHVIVSYPSFQPADFLRGFIMYGVLLPISGGILFGLLGKSETERISAETTLNQEERESQRIALSLNWKDLVETIAEFPSRFLPVSVSTLYIVERADERLVYAAGWGLDPSQLSIFTPEIPLSHCSGCQIRHENANHLVACSCELSTQNHTFPSSFCLPLTHGDQMIGLIFVAFPASMTIPLHQVKVFTRMAPEISLALDRALLHRSMLNQAAFNELERRKIAQDLHDSLAQNIGYLRLKLDQLTGEDAVSEINEIRLDLNHMKEIADQSYDQVRETLTHLRPTSAEDLEAFLYNFLKTIGDRSTIAVQFETTGRPLPVSLGVYRQITFICQEALINIEKHAQAAKIEMDLNWSEDSLAVTIWDNGCGFNPTLEAFPGHYGIAIMKERADEVHASFEIQSAPDLGTKVILRVPLQDGNSQPPTRIQVSENQWKTSVQQSLLNK